MQQTARNSILVLICDCLGPSIRLVMVLSGNRGRVHITNVEEAGAADSQESPLSRFKAGDSLQAVILGTVATKQVDNIILHVLSILPPK